MDSRARSLLAVNQVHWAEDSVPYAAGVDTQGLLCLLALHHVYRRCHVNRASYTNLRDGRLPSSQLLSALPTAETIGLLPQACLEAYRRSESLSRMSRRCVGGLRADQDCKQDCRILCGKAKGESICCKDKSEEGDTRMRESGGVWSCASMMTVEQRGWLPQRK